MRPITFRCNATLPLAPEAVAGQIRDLARRPECAGCGPLPGTTSAEFETRASDGFHFRQVEPPDPTALEKLLAEMKATTG